MKKSVYGLFIVIEGADASGKSTLINRCEARLSASGIFTHVNKEPNNPSSDFADGFSLGQELRDIMSTHPSITDATRLLLMYAARLENFHKNVLPVLNLGGVVLSDRWSPSTRVYQVALCKIEQAGYRRQLSSVIRQLDKLLYSFYDAQGHVRRPDMNVIITVSPRVAAQRLGITGNTNERDVDAIEEYTFSNSFPTFIERYKKANQAYKRVGWYLRLMRQPTMFVDEETVGQVPSFIYEYAQKLIRAGEVQQVTRKWNA